MNKVLIFSPSHGIWGGGQIYIEQLCNFLNMEEDIESYIITSEPESFKCPALKMKQVLSKKYRLIEAQNIAKKYRLQGFRYIILNDLSSLWLAPIFKMYGFKVISLLHLYLQTKKENPLGHSSLEYLLLKFSSKFCDKIFSVNKDNIKVFGMQVEFIGNYVPDWFFEAPKTNKKKYDFIIIARLAKQKNIPLFLEVLANLNNKGNNYSLLIVGEGPEKENIINKIEALRLKENVILKPWSERKDLPNIYDLGKVFVISSYHEGFPTTLLEAHARGLPAVVTKSSGFAGEFVEGYGDKTGVVFEFNDVNNQDFLGAVEKLVSDYDKYEKKSISKAKKFTEDIVLGPIKKYIKESS